MQTESICFICKHYSGNGKCKAFSEGIPYDILYGVDSHDKPTRTQKNDIVFEAIK